MIRFSCPGCKAVLETSDGQAGTVFSCPKCTLKMKIPASVPAKAASVSSSSQGSTGSVPVASQPNLSKVSSVEPVPCSETQTNIAAATAPILPQSKPTHTNPRDHFPETKTDPDISRMPLWKKPLLEIQEIAMATWGQTERAFRFAQGKWHQRSLRKAVPHARLTLGQRLVEKQCGDVQVRGQIAALDEKIRILTEGKGSTKAPKAERDRLIMALADEALGKSTAPPGVEEDYQKATKAQSDIQAHTDKMANLRGGLFPTASAHKWAV